MSEKFYWQMISRNNDINGNPYRLIFVYDDTGFPIEVYEARSSSPNKEYEFYSRPNYYKLPTFHLSPKEYNAKKRSADNWSNCNGVINCD